MEHPPERIPGKLTFGQVIAQLSAGHNCTIESLTDPAQIEASDIQTLKVTHRETGEVLDEKKIQEFATLLNAALNTYTNNEYHILVRPLTPGEFEMGIVVEKIEAK